MNPCRNVLAVSLDIGPCDDLGTNGGLNWNFKVLPRNNLFELGRDFASPFFGKVAVRNEA